MICVQLFPLILIVICIDVRLYTRFLHVVNWLWLLSIFAGLKTLDSFQYRGGAVEFFLVIKFNHVIIRIKLCRCVERNQHLVAHIGSQLVLLAARMTCP
jgi:hypothetical protein